MSIPVAHAISVGKPTEDPSPEAELKSFTVLDGFEVSLFASEKDGVGKPISMRWDERGRLWVITAKSYPQPEPGDAADDKVLILEDTDHDGKADKVTVFADGLRMPMGLELAPSARWPEAVTSRSGDWQSPTKTHLRSGKNEASARAANAEVASTAIANRRSLDGELYPMAAYIGEQEKLWIMRDLDGDGKADVREVVFSGFGTGDTHQCINSFTWTPDGALLFSQGLHCYSNVTTPWGGRRLYGAGFWMYRPLRAELTPFPTGFPANAWGTVYDDAGQPFTVAGAAGMFWTTPLLVPQYGNESAGQIAQGPSRTSMGAKRRADLAKRAKPADKTPDAPAYAPGTAPYAVHLIERLSLPNSGQIVKQGMLKYCGVDIPRNAHWPAEMHGELVSGGFFENCIYRHKLQPDKENPSSYEAVRQPDLLKSSSVAFRPVDVKFGPDGALYISDWYNPIIGHYQASFRHPDRDKVHGRIWRVVKKGAPLVKMREMEKLGASELLALLGKTTLLSSGAAKPTTEVSSFLGDRWEEYQAQRLLMGKSKDEVKNGLAGLKKDLLARDRMNNHFGMMERELDAMFESPNDAGLKGFAENKNPAFRAFAARLTGLWQDRLQDPLGSLGMFISNQNPRVRLEAIAACARIPKPESIAIALRALDPPGAPASVPASSPDSPPGMATLPGPYFDSFHERALDLAVYALAPYWEPALREGKLTLPPKHLAWLLDKKSDGDTLTRIRGTLREKPETFDADSRRALLLMLAKRGGSEDVSAALNAGMKDAVLLEELADLVEAQQIKAPANAEAKVGDASRFATGGHIQDLQTSQQPKGDKPAGGEADVLRSETHRLLSAATRLIGLWKLTALAPQLKAQLAAADAPLESKRASVIALARLNTAHDLILKLSADAQQPLPLRLAAVEALALGKEAAPAANAALDLMPQAKTEEDMRALLAPFLAKAGRMKPLVAALTEKPCSKEAADLASRALIAMGRNEPELNAALNKVLGRTSVVMPFDAQWVSSLGNEAIVTGNAKRGDEIYHRPALNCIACHQINNQGGIIGPQLDAVGRGVPVELLVEAVMWPQRQIKEGYVATTVIMKDGRTLVGYKVKETESELTVRDLATKVETALQKSQMQTRTDAGSLMPDGLTASLSRDELRDLMAYLASLGKEEKK